MIKRRTVIRNIMVGGVGTAFGSSFVPSAFTDSEIKAAPVGKPKRVIFFLQNNGFHTDTCIPLGMSRLSVPVCIGILLFARTTLAPNPLSVSNLEADNSVAAQLASFQVAEGYEVNLFAYELRDFIKYLSILKNGDSPK